MGVNSKKTRRGGFFFFKAINLSVRHFHQWLITDDVKRSVVSCGNFHCFHEFLKACCWR
ncbi:hypothetical protein ABH908_003158 [Pseudomonas frederiksbergensis]